MPPPKPTTTRTMRMFVRLMDLMTSWSRRRSIAASVALFAGAIAANAWGGAAFNLYFLYFVACTFAVWCVGGHGGMMLSLLAAVTVATIKHYQLPELLGHPVQPMTEAWNLGARMLSFGLYTAFMNGFRAVLLLERWHASHDGLTEVFNKTGFEKEAAKAIARAQSRGDNLLLVFIDLDGFKNVNDTYGHAAGDRVLQTFAAMGREAIRPADLFARFGGDEFVALLIIPREVDGGSIAELMHERFTAILAQTGFDVTCSMGATVMAGDDTSATAMMEEVDGLMYEAKRAGKNGLRLGRGMPLARALQTAFPPLACDDLKGFLQSIDLAERGERWRSRSVA